ELRQRGQPVRRSQPGRAAGRVAAEHLGYQEHLGPDPERRRIGRVDRVVRVGGSVAGESHTASGSRRSTRLPVGPLGEDGGMRVESPIGPLVVAATETGLVRVSFGGPEGGDDGPPSTLAEVRRQLDAYFAGRRRTFDLPLDWSSTSGFQRQVLRVL